MTKLQILSLALAALPCLAATEGTPQWETISGKWSVDGGRLVPDKDSAKRQTLWADAPAMADCEASARVSIPKDPVLPEGKWADAGLALRATQAVETRVVISFGGAFPLLCVQTWVGSKFHQNWASFGQQWQTLRQNHGGTFTLKVSVTGRTLLVSVPEVSYQASQLLPPETSTFGKAGLCAANLDVAFSDFQLADTTREFSNSPDGLAGCFEFDGAVLFGWEELRLRLHHKPGDKPVPCSFAIKDATGKSLLDTTIDLNQHAQGVFVKLPAPPAAPRGEFQLAFQLPGGQTSFLVQDVVLAIPSSEAPAAADAWLNSEVKEHMGVPTLFIANHPVYSIMRRHTVPRSGARDSLMALHRSYKAGVRIFLLNFIESDYAPLNTDGSYDFHIIQGYLEKLAALMPEAKVVLCASLKPPPGLPEEELPLFSDGLSRNTRVIHQHKLGAPSLCSKSFAQACRRQLDDLMAGIAASPAARRLVFGLMLCGGGWEGNWGGPGELELVDASPAARQAFSEWLKRARGDQDASTIPNVTERTTASLGGFLDPVKSRRAIDFNYFNNTVPTVELCLAALANHARERTGGKALVFAFGLTNSALAHFDPASWKVLLECPGPLATGSLLQYYGRGLGGDSAYYSEAFLSARLHNQLVFLEDDLRSHMDPAGTPYRASDTGPQTVALMRRSFGQALCNGRLYDYYFDITGPRCYDDPDILAEFRAEVDVCNKVMAFPYVSAAETLLVLDNRPFAYRSMANPPIVSSDDPVKGRLSERTFEADLNSMAIRAMRRAGIAFDTVFAEDLDNPALERYRLYIFPEQFVADQALRERIVKLVRRPGVTSLFVHAPGFVIPDKPLDTRNIGDLTGIQAGLLDKMIPMAAAIADTRTPLAQGLKSLGDPKATAFEFYVDDPDALPLAVYPDGKTAAAMKTVGQGNVVYSCVPIVTPGFYRNLARAAGVHVYSERDDTMAASGSFVSLHAKGDGDRTIKLPKKAKVVDVFAKKALADNADTFTVGMRHGETALFYIGGKVELFANK